MNRFVSLALVFIIVLQSVGLYLLNWEAIENCRVEFKMLTYYNTKNENNFISFNSKDKNFELLGNDELISNGHHFDIVKKKYINGNWQYFAIGDQKEDYFTKKIQECASNNSLPYRNASKYKIIEKNKDTPVINFLFHFFSITCFLMRVEMKQTFSYLSPLRFIFVPPPNSQSCFYHS